ncbi:putative transcription factor Iwr1 [Lyophyllum shimeji]|uniref:Probable RNA polymerase II nuclear localization protein SLC7A6OS n=1 Tax=Lyophyllum shimeji TaxID=47721 RepID=A0A9P3UNU7_LYOSH|nr:putative transcription factor Iwr1 [Lyophyllum shimeji]
MEVENESPAPQTYTLLRIKRKRNEEPLDALVVESRVRRKKSRPGIGVFKFAQTVESDVWEDEKRAKDIQDQISRLAKEEENQREAALTEVPGVVPPGRPRPKADDARHYTILQRHVTDETHRITRPKSPPKVISSKDLPPKHPKADFKMFDAVRADKDLEGPPTTFDAEMEKFLPMLDQYLKMHDVSLDPEETNPAVGDVAPRTAEADDYVWDVFYHREASLSEWNIAANVGTLSGLPPSITDPYETPSDSEPEDEVDEDSNAEEYYKNDYPEGDESEPSPGSESGSDMFHETSDYGEVVHFDELSD